VTASRADDLVKVVVKLEKDEDDYPPADYEGLWARALGEGLFQVDNIPFFAKGIAYGDIVSAVTEPRELRFREKEVSTVGALLEKLGCAIERSHIPGLISVDVPPAVNTGVTCTKANSPCR